jgi:hypothetical protein
MNVNHQGFQERENRIKESGIGHGQANTGRSRTNLERELIIRRGILSSGPRIY